jgi:hypothetical protein
MTFTIPNIETSPTFDGQSVPDATDFQTLALGLNGTGVDNGCGVTAQSSPNMTVQVAAGNVTIIGTGVVAVAAVTSLAIGSPVTYDRKDIVVVNSSGVVSVVPGSYNTIPGWTRPGAGLPPVKGAIPANSALLAEVYVAGTGDPNSAGGATAAIYNANIIDKSTICATAGPLIATFNASTTWTVPGGVYVVEVFAVGPGGGGGGGSTAVADGSGGGGGGGQVAPWVPTVVAPGQVLTITIATSGGSAGGSNGSGGTAAATTVTGSSPTVSISAASGGAGAAGGNNTTGGGVGGNYGGGSGGGYLNAATQTEPGHGQYGGGGKGGLSTAPGGGNGGGEPWFGYSGGGAGSVASGGTPGSQAGTSGGTATAAAAGGNGTANRGGGGGGGAAFLTTGKSGGAGGTGQVVFKYWS